MFTELTKFWLNEIIELNSSKIWLTVIVYNKKNKSYTLINNLPFNILDYSDITIVLKQVFETKNLSNRKDLLNKIVFKFNYVNNFKLTWYIMYLIYIITILLMFIALIICLEASQFNYDLTSDEIFSTLNDKFESTVVSETLNSVTKQCIFDPFIKLLNSTYYFPSHFLSAKLP